MERGPLLGNWGVADGPDTMSPHLVPTSPDMSLYLEAYDAAVLRYWGEMLARHHRSLRRPYARDWVRVPVDDDTEDGVAAPIAWDAPGGETKR